MIASRQRGRTIHPLRDVKSSSGSLTSFGGPSVVSESRVRACVTATSASERRCSIQSCLSSNVMYRTLYPFGHSLAKCPGSPQRLQSIGIGFLRRTASISMGVGMLDARAGTPGYCDVWNGETGRTEEVGGGALGAGNGVREVGVNATTRCVPWKA